MHAKPDPIAERWAPPAPTPPPQHIDVHFPSRLEIHVHIKGDGGQQPALAQILAGIATLTTGQGKIMATQAEFTTAFQRVDTATTAIAALIRTLIDRPLSGMSAAEEDAVKAQLEGVATSLEAIASTPTDPVPVPVPDPIP